MMAEVPTFHLAESAGGLRPAQWSSMMRSAPQAGTTPELELAAETFAPACMARA